MDKPAEATRIQIVEDEPEMRTMLGEILALPGYRVEAAADGSEALARAQQDPPDLVILDLNLPDVDGFEVCRQLKGDARTAHVPILIVTGLHDMTSKEKGLAAGADEYVTKPVDGRDLLTRVRALLRVSHLSRELDRTLAYLQELEVDRRGAAGGSRDGRPAAAGRGPAPPRGVESGGHVLVVDDDRFVRQLFGHLFEEAGFRVTAVAGAAEAYGLAAGADVILLDLMMPGTSGLEALERFRTLAPDTPVIMVTAFQTTQNAAAALQGGAFDFVVKGMRPEMLLNRVARALERRRLVLEVRRLREQLQARAPA